MDFPTVWQQLLSREWMWTFGRSAMEGAQLAKQGRVKLRTAELLEGKELEITAFVTDNRLTQFETTVTLQFKESTRLSIMSRCLCPAGAYCKHAAALLTHATDKKLQDEIEERATAPPPAAPKSAPAISRASKPVLRHDTSRPEPVLVLRRVDANLPKDAKSSKLLRLPVADPMVIYPGCPDRLLLTVRTPHHEWEAEGTIHQLTRDLELERTFLRDVMLLGLMPFMEAHPGVITSAPLNHLAVSQGYELEFWKGFRQEESKHLQQKGWRIEASHDFGYDVIQLNEQHWVTGLRPEPGNGLVYSLEMGVEIDGKRVSLIPILAEAVQKGLTVQEVTESPDTPFLFLVPELGDRLISLPGRRLLPILSVLHELFTPGAKKKDKLKVDRLRAAQLGKEQGMALQMPAEIAQLGEKLATFTSLPTAEPPAGLQATLRPYQQEGLSWLQFLREYGLHGILADDMGLGKTLQTITHLLAEVESGRADRPSLILAPTSVIRNWAAEAKKFAPSMKVLVLHGENRRERFPFIKNYHIVVTSYPLLIRDIEKLQKFEWHVVVLDEAHGIKNARAKAAQAARALNARHRLCLTGTPMENHLGELWSLFHFLMPGYLGEQDAFKAFFRNPIEKKQDPTAQQRLSARLQPVLLRRTKDAVAKDLPPKTELINAVELDKAQADLYETIRATVDKRVREAIADQGIEKSQLIVLDALLKLRQVCCHPALLKTESAKKVETSAKTDYLMDEMLPELIEEGRRILIFSQFTSMLDLLERMLKERGTRYVKLTGSTEDRTKPVEQFQKGDIPIFLISLKAGGVGITLTAADTVIHYDPWWNPAIEAQATDRALPHRPNQNQSLCISSFARAPLRSASWKCSGANPPSSMACLPAIPTPPRLTQEDVREFAGTVVNACFEETSRSVMDGSPRLGKTSGSAISASRARRPELVCMFLSSPFAVFSCSLNLSLWFLKTLNAVSFISLIIQPDLFHLIRPCQMLLQTVCRCLFQQFAKMLSATRYG